MLICPRHISYYSQSFILLNKIWFLLKKKNFWKVQKLLVVSYFYRFHMDFNFNPVLYPQLIQAGKGEALRIRAILRSLVPIEDLVGVISLPVQIPTFGKGSQNGHHVTISYFNLYFSVYFTFYSQVETGFHTTSVYSTLLIFHRWSDCWAKNVSEFRARPQSLHGAFLGQSVRHW